MKAVRLPLRQFPRLRIACRNPLEDRHFFPEYSGAYFTLHFCEYEGLIRIGREEYAVRPGDVTLTPARVPRSYHLRKPGTHLLLAFTLDAGAGNGRSVFSIPSHLSLGRAGELARMRFLQTIQAHARGLKQPLALMQARVLLQELLLWLAQQAGGSGAPGGSALDRCLNEVIEVMDRHYPRPLSVAGLSSQVGLSQNYLARRFRERHGMTIPRYLLRLRLKHAHELLVSTALPVKVIGARVGIPNAQHFNKQFRRAFGRSPSAARTEGAAAVPRRDS